MLLRTGWRLPNSMLFRHQVRRRPHGVLRARPGRAVEDYAHVLPDLAQRYHVFAVDCFGHGESSHDPALYSCEAIGRALKSFAAQKIGACYLVSGHSSGGIIAAWLAANDAERVSACVLEDPPSSASRRSRCSRNRAASHGKTASW